MMPRGLSKGLAVGLIVTLIVAWFAPSPYDDSVALSERAQQTVARNSNGTRTAPSHEIGSRVVLGADAVPIQVLNIHPRQQNGKKDTKDGRLFAPTQWTLPTQNVPVVVAAPAESIPAPPHAPPLPFRVLGRYDEMGQTVIFLEHLDRNLVVRVGDTIAEQYKVESLNGTTLTLRYLPLNQLQTLEVGSEQWK